MVNVLILLKLGIIRFYQIKYLRTIFKIRFMQAHSSLFFFSFKKNSFRSLYSGSLLDFIYNKSKLYFGFTQSVGLRLSP